MNKKIISIEEYKQTKEDYYLPESFTINDIYRYSNMIEYYLNTLSTLDSKYKSFISTEQFSVLSQIFSSFFNICYSEIEDFDDNIGSNRILYKFASELYRVCNNLKDLENIDENKILKFKKDDE